jgi:hypothetical protein
VTTILIEPWKIYQTDRWMKLPASERCLKTLIFEVGICSCGVTDLSWSEWQTTYNTCQLTGCGVTDLSWSEWQTTYNTCQLTGCGVTDLSWSECE